MTHAVITVWMTHAVITVWMTCHVWTCTLSSLGTVDTMHALWSCWGWWCGQVAGRGRWMCVVGDGSHWRCWRGDVGRCRGQCWWLRSTGRGCQSGWWGWWHGPVRVYHWGRGCHWDHGRRWGCGHHWGCGQWRPLMMVVMAMWRDGQAMWRYGLVMWRYDGRWWWWLRTEGWGLFMMPKLSVDKCQHSIWVSVAMTNRILFRLLGYMVRAQYSYIYMTNSIILLNTSESNAWFQWSLMCFGQNLWEKSPVGQANNAQSHAKKKSHRSLTESIGIHWTPMGIGGGG